MIHTYPDTNVVPDPSETHAHFEITKFIRRNQNKYPSLKNYFGFSNPGKLNLKWANLLTMTGFSRGFPDIVVLSKWSTSIPIENGCFQLSMGAGLAIELKVGDGRTSKEQIDWLERLSEQGFYSAVCYGSDSAINLIKTLYL